MDDVGPETKPLSRGGSRGTLRLVTISPLESFMREDTLFHRARRSTVVGPCAVPVTSRPG